MIVEALITLSPYIISLAGVCVSAYSLYISRRTALNAHYFSIVTEAYSKFVSSTTNFVYIRDSESLNQLSDSLYQVLLVTTDEIADEASELYRLVLDWAESGDTTFPYDDKIHDLQKSFRADLAFLTKKCHRK